MEMVEVKRGDFAQVIEVATSQLTEHSKQTDFSPMMSKKKWSVFVTGIAKEGILQPLVVTKGFRVIDGKHRLKAAKELGIEGIRVIVEDITEDEIPNYIAETKLNRDDLKPGQKAAIVIRLYYEEEKQKAKSSQGTRTDISPELEESLAGEVAAILAKKAGISKTNMYYLLSVYKKRIDLFEIVFNGEKAIGWAHAQMKADEAPEELPSEPAESTIEKVKEVVEESDRVASLIPQSDEDEDSLSPISLLRNRISTRIPQFTREFIHDFDLLSSADKPTVEAYNKQLHSVAEGALLLLETFEMDAKKKLFFEFITKTFLISKDEKKLNQFLESMGGILNEEE